jgi:hypothetical protein
MKKIHGLFIKTTIVVLLACTWLIACRRDLITSKPTGTDPRAVLPTGQYSVIYTLTPADSVDDSPRELGMKFKSIVPGTFTKISFYKMVNDSGTHIGHLWDSAGTLLATVTFSGETARGWQFASLGTAYSVTANKTYVVSVSALHGYGYLHSGLASPLNNGPLVSIADGNNGVYANPGVFPTSSSVNTNYFRDVVFVPTTDDPTAPTVPTGLTVSSITSSSATLSWTASTDNVAVTGYEIWRNGYLIDTISGTAHTRNLVHLNAAGLYSFSVKARDAFGNRSAASTPVDFLTTNPGTLTDGASLTTSMVGPGVIGITSFTTVAGGTFAGAALSGWGSAARTVAAGGETIDGFWFPAGTIVLQGADISSLINMISGWLVLRGCKGRVIASNPVGDDGGLAVLYSQMIAVNAAGRKDNMQARETIVHRCYFPTNGLENVYSDNVTVTENWINPYPDTVGTDHIDGIQTWGGQAYLNFSRNHIEFHTPYNSSLSGMMGMYSDGSQAGYNGYDHFKVNNNYFVLGATGNALHAPLGVPVSYAEITGNRWTWSSSAGDKDHSAAVYLNVSQTIPNYHATGNNWSNNKWVDGPYAGYYVLPSDVTDSVDY